MQAEIAKWKDWSDGTTTPILSLTANRSNEDEVNAVRQLAEAASGIPGKKHHNYSLVRLHTNNLGLDILTIDISSLILLVANAKNIQEKQQLPGAWIANWVKDAAKPEWLNAKHREKPVVFSCRCGVIKKSEKKLKAHQRKCSLLKSLAKLFKRTDGALSRVKKEIRNAKTKEHNDSSKTSKGKKLHREVAERHKDSSSRAKARRTKRDNSSQKRKGKSVHVQRSKSKKR